VGNGLFGANISGIIAGVLGPQVLPVTITKSTPGARTPGNLTAGRTKTTRAFPCRGFWEDYTGPPPATITLQLGDRKAILLGDTIPLGGIPQRGDTITIEGQSLFVWQLQSRDPDAAVYTFQCRDRLGPDGT
jgi:hypothetical protein